MDDDDGDVFKREFKRFKKPNQEDMKYVIDFTQPDKFDEIISGQPVGDSPARVDEVQCHELGLMPQSEWKVFKLKPVPGLIVIVNPFLSGGQHYWIQKCLLQYPLLPNVTNLDSHIVRQGSGQIWPDNDPVGPAVKDSLLYKLRWVTLGYHYDWTNKLYHKERHSPFPTDLSLLSRFILASACGFPGFRAEAAIVNYYHFESTLSGHTDHSESDLTFPLISISFGQSAIFLIGGQTKSHAPVPLLIRSGDIVIMSGESRLAYHGIPKILRPTDYSSPLPHCLSEEALFKKRIETKSSYAKCSICCCKSTQRGTSVLKRERSGEEMGESDYSSKRKAWNETSELESNTETEFETLEPDTKHQNRESKDDTDSAIPLSAATSGTETETHNFVCPDCEWLRRNWTRVESYLSYSRININVRQVGDIK